MTFDYCFCGWRLRSALELPALPPFDGAADTPVDIEVSLGAVPPALPDPVRSTPFQQVGRDGSVLVRIDGVARLRLEGGHTLVVAPAPDAAPADVALFLQSSGLGMLAHQRGLLPLHASVVEIHGRTVAFAGHSGAGKSTLAASLLARGHRPLADDLCLLRTDRAARIEAWPLGARLKLWRPSLAALEFDPGRLVRSRQGQDKFVVEMPPPTATTAPRRLDMVLILTAGSAGDDDRVEWLSGFDALVCLVEHTYRRTAAQALGRGGELMRQAGAILGPDGPRLGLLRRALRFERLETQIHLLETLAGGDRP